MGLRDIGETLPPGFRFYPSDEELVCHYLYKKIANEDVVRGTLVEIDLHTCEPWQLPDVAKLNSNEWYFFSFRDRKYATGYRANRATATGYWKATGKDRVVIDPRTRATVGMRKTLVFYKNRAPNGIKTGWIMHEFRLENPLVPPKEDWVLCRVFYKSRDGTENSNKFPQNIVYNPTNNATSPTLAASPTTEHVLPSSIVYQNITSLSHSPSLHNQHQNPISFHHNQHQNPSTSIGLSALDSGYLNLAQHHMNAPLVEAKFEDDYRFLLGMSFEDSNGFLHSSCEDRMGLIDDDEDNGMVFI